MEIDSAGRSITGDSVVTLGTKHQGKKINVGIDSSDSKEERYSLDDGVGSDSRSSLSGLQMGAGPHGFGSGAGDLGGNALIG